MKLRASRGHASSQQVKRFLVDSDEDNVQLLSYLDEVLEPYEVSRASAKAPRVPIAGTSTVSMSHEKLRADQFSRVISSPCMPCVTSPGTPFRYPFDRRIPKRNVAHFAICGLGFLANLHACRWTKVGPGEMRCGRTYVRIEGSDYNFKGLARTPWILGSRNVLARGVFNRFGRG